MEFLRFCPCNWGTRKRVDTAPKTSGCFREGHNKSSALFQKICWEEPQKAEDAKLPGAGIIPKRCPMKRAQRSQ